MIPRLHPRGTSFKGACAYVLHDASKAETSDRVEWAMTRNLSTQDPNWAWHEMYETYAAQGALKAAAGVDARGRKNTRPVLHYTLSWHERDQPTAEEMKEAALDSLKVLGLHEHEALIASHKDKQHMHVHIVVSTVHPETGLTAPMKFSKLELSRWAEGYEILNGLHCDARMKNNAERARLKADREREALDALLGASKGQTPKKRVPYVPVKDRQSSRKEWFDRKEITDRAKALRDAVWQEFRQRGDVLWDRQQKEWEAATGNTQGRVDGARASVRAKYQPRWRNLYFTQKKQARQIARIAESPLDRAAFVYQNRDWLGMPGKPLTPRQTLALVTSGPRLMKHVAGIHERERQELARESKTETKSLTEAIWAEHKGSMRVLKESQTAEREALRDNRSAARKLISWDDAKASLVEERAKIERPFEQPPGPMEVTHRFHEAAQPSPDHPSAEPAISRAEQIKRDAAAWLKRRGGMDFEREM